MGRLTAHRHWLIAENAYTLSLPSHHIISIINNPDYPPVLAQQINNHIGNAILENPSNILSMRGGLISRIESTYHIHW